jgi:hypothetical protein
VSPPLCTIGSVIAGPNIECSFVRRESLKEHIEDAVAELAFAKLHNLVWNGNPLRGCGPSGEDVYVQGFGAGVVGVLALSVYDNAFFLLCF